MSHMRFDRWTERWVMIAPGRRGIGAVRPQGLPTPEGRCPFCPGHEADTEETVFELLHNGTWDQRVVRNRYPLVEANAASPSLARARAANGVHEVIVECREHDGDFTRFDKNRAIRVLQTYRERVRAIETQSEVACVQLFRNCGRRAGSSQPHPHAQVVALPIVPRQIAARWEVAKRFRTTGTRLIDHILQEEREAFVRVIRDADEIVTFVPYASERAFHTIVAPAFPCERFSSISDRELSHFAPRLVDATRRAITAAGTTDFNIILRDAPMGTDLGFYFDILPRTGGDAGFELATDMPVSSVLPEEAASDMRDVS